MRCKQVRQWTDEYLFGTLSDERKQKLVGHLSSCTSCAQYVKEMRQMHDALSGLEEDLQPAFRQRLHRHLNEVFQEEYARPLDKKPWAANTWKKLGTVLAAAALVFLIYLVKPFSLFDSGIKEMPAADSSGALIQDAEPAEASAETTQAEAPAAEVSITSLDESYMADEIILYLLVDENTMYEDILNEISSIAADFNMEAAEIGSDHIILHVSEDTDRAGFLGVLSRLGRLEFSDRKSGGETITIQLKTE